MAPARPLAWLVLEQPSRIFKVGAVGALGASNAGLHWTENSGKIPIQVFVVAKMAAAFETAFLGSEAATHADGTFARFDSNDSKLKGKTGSKHELKSHNVGSAARESKTAGARRAEEQIIFKDLSSRSSLFRSKLMAEFRVLDGDYRSKAR